jgi:hypothetical protein
VIVSTGSQGTATAPCAAANNTTTRAAILLSSTRSHVEPSATSGPAGQQARMRPLGIDASVLIT